MLLQHLLQQQLGGIIGSISPTRLNRTHDTAEFAMLLLQQLLLPNSAVSRE